MALIRWEPARELRLLNTLFDTPTFPQTATRRWIPAVDVVESDSHYVLRADLPGLSEDDIDIELDANVLTISGERKSEHEERKGGYYRVERISGSFRRSLRVRGDRPRGDHGKLRARRPGGDGSQARAAQVAQGPGHRRRPGACDRGHR